MFLRRALNPFLSVRPAHAQSPSVSNPRRFAAMRSEAQGPAGASSPDDGAAGASAAGGSGPVEAVIRHKITAGLRPVRLDIVNDSHLHRHHRAMAGSTSAETHFRLVVVSSCFDAVNSMVARHRIVNRILKDDLAREGGIHALQISAMTPDEFDKKQKSADKSHETVDESGA